LGVAVDGVSDLARQINALLDDGAAKLRSLQQNLRSSNVANGAAAAGAALADVARSHRAFMRTPSARVDAAANR
jgi:hypothetical protein